LDNRQTTASKKNYIELIRKQYQIPSTTDIDKTFSRPIHQSV